MSIAGEPLAAVPEHDRPRERLLRLGPEALSDAEVLALVLGSGRTGQNVVVFARKLLAHVGGFAGLLSLTPEQLLRLPGVGPATTGRLVGATEMWRRGREPSANVRLVDSASIARAVLPELVHRHSERFLVVVTDRGLRLREVVLLREGTEHRVQIEIREVLQIVLTRRGAAFAVAHNHPAGSMEPSAADVSITSELRAAAETVGLRFLDHLIVSGGDWSSIA